ncbi:MAG: hypothetical protein EA356_10665 [Geminicoccaceae bacterium]|nr:MAG: hypothetical protein EA356_10665 [Geminicoccaceae bacterium]
MSPTRPASLLWLVAGFGLWSTALILVYALHAVGCAFVWPPAAIRLGLALVLLAHVAALLALIHHQRRRTVNLLLQVALWTLVAALVATAFTYGPLLLLTPCV